MAMTLNGPDRQRLELAVAGYEFSDQAENAYGANWLVINGSVEHPQGSWTFTHPCHLTWEVSSLAE